MSGAGVFFLVSGLGRCCFSKDAYHQGALEPFLKVPGTLLSWRDVRGPTTGPKSSLLWTLLGISEGRSALKALPTVPPAVGVAFHFHRSQDPGGRRARPEGSLVMEGKPRARCSLPLSLPRAASLGAAVPTMSLLRHSCISSMFCRGSFCLFFGYRVEFENNVIVEVKIF